MPIHDWTRLEAGDFHHFHQRWISAIADALNVRVLPDGYMAMAEQVTGRPIPDVVALQTRRPERSGAGGIAIKERPPSAKLVARYEGAIYSRQANRVIIRHGRGRVVAIIEIVSPGNKSSQHAIRTFVEKACDILSQGIHLLVVDLFPPSSRDPNGLPGLIASEMGEDALVLPADKPLSAVSYEAGDVPTAYLEPLGVADALPSLPIFLNEEEYVPAPLEETYMQSWAVYPAMLKELIAQPNGE